MNTKCRWLKATIRNVQLILNWLLLSKSLAERAAIPRRQRMAW